MPPDFGRSFFPAGVVDSPVWEALITPAMTRPPDSPDGSVSWSSDPACMMSVLPSESRIEF